MKYMTLIFPVKLISGKIAKTYNGSPQVSMYKKGFVTEKLPFDNLCLLENAYKIYIISTALLKQMTSQTFIDNSFMHHSLNCMFIRSISLGQVAGA